MWLGHLLPFGEGSRTILGVMMAPHLLYIQVPYEMYDLEKNCLQFCGLSFLFGFDFLR